MSLRFYFILLSSAIAVWLFYLSMSSYGSINRAKTKHFNLNTSFDVSDVKNDTLGVFSNIFVVSMPDRTDKRDAFSLAASLTGIRFKWRDGVDGSKTNEKAVPDSWDRDKDNRTYGCWRAHMNIAQEIVKDLIQSALIMEDDADWDVNLKNQLVELARGSRHILGQETRITDSPYGDDWDVLWIGHCGTNNFNTTDQRYYIIRDDPTAVPQSLWDWPERQPNFSPLQWNSTFNRVVYRPNNARCMFGYALSLQGARRFLQNQAFEQAFTSDRALNRLCVHHSGTCIAPYPPLISTYKAAGSSVKDSDRQDTGGKYREKARTAMIIFSTKLNLKSLIPFEENTTIKSQWPGQTLLNEINGTINIPNGESVMVKKKYMSS